MSIQGLLKKSAVPLLISIYCSFWHCPKKNEKGLVRFNLSPRESQNFRPLRKPLKVAHFGFPPSAGPESGQATASLTCESFLIIKELFRYVKYQEISFPSADFI